MSKFHFRSLNMAALFLRYISRYLNLNYLAKFAVLPRIFTFRKGAGLLIPLTLTMVFSTSVMARVADATTEKLSAQTAMLLENHASHADKESKKTEQKTNKTKAAPHQHIEEVGEAGHVNKGDKNDVSQGFSQSALQVLSSGYESAEDNHQEGVSFSAEKMALAGIEVSAISAKTFASHVYAPGEIKANGYKSYIVSPRTESVVVSRHATLGQHVEKGDALVTLFSESVAEAQAKYRVAYNDWQRNKKLGKETVSESQLLSAETDYISAYSRLKAFGLTEGAIAQIVKGNLLNAYVEELGEYTLIAQRAGAVLSDDFSQGQRVSAGDAIMVLADESELWVEARVSPNKQLNLPKGTQATIEMADQYFVATVIQEAHTIDPKTRTRIVRLAVKNDHDRLHPGMFVNVNFSFETNAAVMAVPESALMRSSDGDWTVFVEDHPGEFTAVEVTLGRSLGGYREIFGLAPLTRIVTKGAFFVASEIAKGGFDPHNH
ncbi:MAG: cobalt-zinc-cadmium efflux system membrane fusion protein [Cognaticolwellia sp.]|jgi:cobalt-zinc-cadmium efflux system membrane fusion protein